jgi:hypothetical protein
MYDWNWNGDWGNLDPAYVAVVVVLALVFVAVGILVWFFFLRNLRDLLDRVSPRNRAMPSGHVWLNFIPLFSLGWFIYTVIKVRDSVTAEYRSRGWTPEGDFGFGVGMATGILSILSFVLGWVPVAAFGAVVGVGELVCWIIYWVRTSRLKNRLGPPSESSAYAPPRPYSGPPPYSPGEREDTGTDESGYREEAGPGGYCLRPRR